jgi:hypothetical protein
MLEEACDKAAVRNMQVYMSHKRFHNGYMNVKGNALQSTINRDKTLNMCIMLCKVTDERVFRRYQLKEEYQLEVDTVLFTKI